MNEKSPESPSRQLRVYIRNQKLHLVSIEILDIKAAQNLQGELSRGIINIIKQKFLSDDNQKSI
jgi:hypothetical protein